MFDIGFWELTVIGVIALLVVGPERLPGVARTIGFWTGRLRRYVSQVRDDLEHELHADELKGLLDKSSGLDGLYEMVEETKGTLDDAKRGVAELADLSELKDVADVADLADGSGGSGGSGGGRCCGRLVEWRH